MRPRPYCEVQRPINQKCSKATQGKLKKAISLKSLPLIDGPINVKSSERKSQDDLQCLCQRSSIEHYPALKTILPENYDYRVCSFAHDENGFKALLRLPGISSDKAQEWKTCLEEISFSTFRVCRTYPGSGRYNIFKVDYACQHSSSRGKGKLNTKKTGCKAEISLTVKRIVKKSRGRDKHLPDYPTSVFLRWCHNHSLDPSHTLRFRDVGSDATRDLIALFHKGYSPASAYAYFRSMLINQWGKNFEKVSQNRQILPEKQYVYRLFAKIKRKMCEQNGSVNPLFETMSDRTKIDVILPAAGNSTRLGLSTPKPFIKVLGSHVIAFTVDCFHRLPNVRHIVLVVSRDRLDSSNNLMKSYGFSKVRVCEGGPTRHRSIYRGVKALRNECNDSNVIIVHDGARPFVSETLINKVALSAEKHGAAGLVRPLVSTVIKGGEKGLLETALVRSNYRNSEMPQAFHYGIIAKAYEKCSDEDFDFGTECLLLALKYSQCPAEMLDGDDDLWKVTYKKDISLMETTLKVKFTKLLLIEKSSQPFKCKEALQASLQARQLEVVTSEKEGANTIICFLDLPSSLSAASAEGENYAKQFQELFDRLPKCVTRLNLMVAIVFCKVIQGQNNAFCNPPMLTYESVPAGLAKQPPATSLQNSPLSKQPQHSSQPQLPLAHSALHSQEPFANLQQGHGPLSNTTPRSVLPQAGTISDPSCLPTMQSQPCGVTLVSNGLQCSRTTAASSFNPPSYSANPQYAPVPTLHHTTPQMCPTNSNNFSLPSQPSPSSNPHLFSPNSSYINQEISFLDLQSPQNMFESQLADVKTKSGHKCSWNPSQTDVAESSHRAECEKTEMELKTSQRFLRTVSQRMTSSGTASCLVGIVCEPKDDVGEQLTDLVWGRHQFLNGQVLFFPEMTCLS